MGVESYLVVAAAVVRAVHVFYAAVVGP